MKQLAILNDKEKLFSVFLEEDILTEVFVDNKNKPSILGNIYIAKVKNVVSNIKAVFVDIGNGMMCYLPLSEGNFKSGDEIIVQVSKEGVKTKQPTVTTKLNLTGRYIVLTKDIEGFSISGKIVEEEERTRLLALKEKLHWNNAHIILRTNCVGVPEESIINEFHALKTTFETIVEKGQYQTCFSLLYENPPPYLTYVRDTKAGELERIITDVKMIYDDIKIYLERYQPSEAKILEYYQDDSYSLNHLLGIESKIKKALCKKVWLNSGGSLVIEPTEALTVIDVNTNKATKGNRNPETTYFKVNKEAAKEIARQLRVRNLSGIIIVDFITMKKKENQTKLLQELRRELKKDKIKTLLIDMTALGLVEITRMKKRKPLHEQIK